MSLELAKVILIAAILLNFQILGASRIRSLIGASALQGAILGVLPLVLHPGFSAVAIIVAAIAVSVKGAIIPALLRRALINVRIRREVEPYLGYIPSMLLGAAGTGAAILFVDSLPLHRDQPDTLVILTSFSTILTGFIILVARKKAITQVIGFLIIENGIFVFGALILEAMPFLVEFGVILDLFVAVFIMMIMVNQIHRTFDSVDSHALSALKE